jgi:hypothetical protein
VRRCSEILGGWIDALDGDATRGNPNHRNLNSADRLANRVTDIIRDGCAE